MTADHDSRISDLYRQSSQETPPAHLDQAVMGRARKSVRRRVYSTFGSNRVARGALLGVVLLCVLLLLDVPQQPDINAPLQEMQAPLSVAPPAMHEEVVPPGLSSPVLPAEMEDTRAVPAAPAVRFDLQESLPEIDVVVPEEGKRERALQLQKSSREEAAGFAVTVPAGPWYLQAGYFHERARADALKEKLLDMGLKCEIREVPLDEAAVYHRVLIGPFADLDVLNTSRQELDGLGFETQLVTDRK